MRAALAGRPAPAGRPAETLFSQTNAGFCSADCRLSPPPRPQLHNYNNNKTYQWPIVGSEESLTGFGERKAIGAELNLEVCSSGGSLFHRQRRQKIVILKLKEFIEKFKAF